MCEKKNDMKRYQTIEFKLEGGWYNFKGMLTYKAEWGEHSHYE
jgi:hypothetical protein